MYDLKESGYGYIGKIPQHWKADKIKYHFRFRGEKNRGDSTVLSLYRELGIVPKDSRDDNHNVTSEDTSNYRFVRVGDFVINKMKAWQGSMAVSGYEGIVSPAYYVYEFVDDSFDKRYFHYLVRNKSYKAEFMRMSAGIRVGQWDLSRMALENTMILIPPMEEQINIAKFLDEKCSEIELLIRDVETQIETLEKYKQSVVYEKITKGLNLDADMRNSGIDWVGRIPQHWAVMPNKYIMHKEKNICPIYDGQDILSLTVNGVIVRDLDAGGKMPTSFDGYQRLEKGNLLMCLFDIDVTPRCIGLIKNNGLSSPAYSQFVLHSNAVPEYYYYYYLMVDYTKELLHMAKNLRHSLTEDQLGAISVPVPPIEEQTAIAQYLDSKVSEIDAIIAQKQEQLTVLDEYKKSLIFEYVTGKKKVGDCVGK